MIISSIKMGGYGCKCEAGNAFCPDTIIEAETPEFGDSRGYTGVLRKGQETEGRNGLCRRAISAEIQERGCFSGSLHEGSEKRMYHDRPAILPVEKWVSYPRAADPSALTRAAFRMVRVLSLMPDQTKSPIRMDGVLFGGRYRTRSAFCSLQSKIVVRLRRAVGGGAYPRRI